MEEAAHPGVRWTNKTEEIYLAIIRDVIRLRLGPSTGFCTQNAAAAAKTDRTISSLETGNQTRLLMTAQLP